MVLKFHFVYAMMKNKIFISVGLNEMIEFNGILILILFKAKLDSSRMFRDEDEVVIILKLHKNMNIKR